MTGNEQGDYESLLNDKLALLLGECPDVERAKPEPLGEPGGRVDVRLEMAGGVVIVVEAKKSNHQAVLEQAASRLRPPDEDSGAEVPDAAIAVVYPEDLETEHLDDSTQLEWAVLFNHMEHPDYTEGTTAALRMALPKTVDGVGDPEVQAAQLDEALKAGVKRLSEQQKKALAEALDLPVQQTVKKKVVSKLDAAAKRGLLVIATAAMFHARLEGTLQALRPETDARTDEPFNDTWPPASLQECRDAEDVVEALREAWQLILAYDYRPIFESACTALTATQQDHAWATAVAGCARAAQVAARSAAALRHDLIGRIFHRLLDSARYDGSFYTSSSAAALLAGLAIRPGDLPDDLAEWKVIDPACGTGTLLMAAAERARDIRRDRDDEAAAEDSRVLIEDVLCGLDVNLTACHMAATTLGLLSPSTAFKHMHIARLLLGMDDKGKPRVGSLELLDAAWQPGQKSGKGQGQMFDLEHTLGEQVDSEELLRFEPNQHHLVIMNPPYTRDSLRHDQLDEAIHDALKKREKELMKGRAGHGSSSGTMFLELGEHLCVLEEGTLAFVFPLAGAGAPSAAEVRKQLGEWFHVEYVVVSHDPERPWFSENTNISEMLVVARRHAQADPAKRPSTKFVCLYRNSTAAHDAVAVADQVLRGNLPEKTGSVWEWPADLMAIGEWLPVTMTSKHLTSAAHQITGGGGRGISYLSTTSLLLAPPGRVFAKCSYSRRWPISRAAGGCGKTTLPKLQV